MEKPHATAGGIHVDFANPIDVQCTNVQCQYHYAEKVTTPGNLFRAASVVVTHGAEPFYFIRETMPVIRYTADNMKQYVDEIPQYVVCPRCGNVQVLVPIGANWGPSTGSDTLSE